MIGKIVITLFPYYNVNKKQYTYKARPALIISEYANDDDEYVVLPIATLQRKEFYDPKYDYLMTKDMASKLGLNQACYIRCHKQTTINKDMIGKVIGDLKLQDNEVYKEVIKIMQLYDGMKVQI